MSSQLKLPLLGEEGLEDFLFFHVCVASAHAVNTVKAFLLFSLFKFGLGKDLKSVVACVFSESHGDLFEGVSEGSDGVLFSAVDVLGFGLDSKTSCDFGGTATPDDLVASDQS